MAQDNPDYGLLICVALLLVYYCAVLAFLVFLSRRYPTVAGFDKTLVRNLSRDVGWGFLLLVISGTASLVYFVLASTLLPIFEDSARFWSPAISAVPTDSPQGDVFALAATLIWVLVFPIFEELFCRGFVQDRFARIFSAKFALFAQAVCFSAWHNAGVFPSIYMFFIGMILGYWRYKHRTLLPVIMAHSMWNCITFFLLGVSFA